MWSATSVGSRAIPNVIVRRARLVTTAGTVQVAGQAGSHREAGMVVALTVPTPC